MHRFIARLTLVWMLVAVLAPAALAVAAPSPHACCKRKPMQQAAPNRAQFSERPSGAGLILGSGVYLKSALERRRHDPHKKNFGSICAGKRDDLL
jgi:hypothetical protein